MVRRRVARIQLREALLEHGRDLRDIARVGMDVRVASRVDVAERPVDDLRDLQLGDVLRSLEISRGPELDLAVAALREQQWKPADLQRRSRSNEQVDHASAGAQ